MTSPAISQAETSSHLLAENDHRAGKRYWLALAVVTVFLCLPVTFTAYAPLVDYPNHLARAHILRHYSAVPEFQRDFQVLIEPIPNIADDLIISSLLRYFDINAASRIFLTLLVLVFVAGCHLLGSSLHGRPTWLALVCAFFVFNSQLLYGFVNYVFGLGLFLISLALFIRYHGRWNVMRWLFVSSTTFFTYLTHLSGFGFLGVSFFVFSLFAWKKGLSSWKNSALSMTPLLPAVLAFALFMKKSGSVGHIVWNSVLGKVLGLLPFFLTYQLALDIVVLAVLLSVAFVLLWRAKEIETVWPATLIAACFFVLYLIAPKTLFTSSAADARLIPAALLLLVLSLKIKMDQRTKLVLSVVVIGALAIRVVSVWAAWMPLDKQIAAGVRQFASMKEGARLYPLVGSEERDHMTKTERSLIHVGQYATISRNAYLPTIFALRGQQPIVLRKPPLYRSYAAAGANPWFDLLGDYDYVWTFKIPASANDALQKKCTLISQEGPFGLWQVQLRRTTPLR